MSTLSVTLHSLLDGIRLPESISSISDADFDAIRELIFREAGISLNDSKKALVASRLAKRLVQLKLRNHAEYLEYLATRDLDGTELQTMVNCLTTNKTDFFREPHHFDFLRETVFPRIKLQAAQGKPRKIRIWSAACSTGEEPYSIAMTAIEHFGMLRGWDFQILASDINTEVLKTASDGIYTQERIEGIDERFLRKYFLRGTGPSTGYFQVRPEVRSLVQFKQINLMDAHWPIHDRFDVIFCRNVIIYFNAQTQQRLLPRLVHQIIDHGHLILGHSENLHWLTDLIAPLGNTVYQRKSSGRATLSAPEPDCVASSRLLPRHVSKKPASLVEEIPHKNHHSTSLAIMRGRRTSATKRREIIAGEYFASREPMIISTLLGSCVGACLFDPEMHIGGMTHFMLPFHHDKMETSSRYGINAMELLINEIMKHGGDRRRLRAKVFGGANVMPQAHWPWDVGKRNIEFIRHFLKTDDIPIVAERLGGKMPLRIVFVPTSGRAFVKEIRARKSILDRELFLLEHAEKPDVQPPFGEVTLF